MSIKIHAGHPSFCSWDLYEDGEFIERFDSRQEAEEVLSCLEANMTLSQRIRAHHQEHIEDAADKYGIAPGMFDDPDFSASAQDAERNR